MTGFAEFIAGLRGDPSEGRTLDQVLTGAARSSWYDQEPERPDPDEQMSALLTRGYRPGELQRLSLALADAQAELQTEQEKIERAARRQQLLMREHQAGRVTAFDLMRADSGDDDGDPGRVALLERRVASLRRQCADMSARAGAAAEVRPVDPLEAASRQAHQVFVEATRARMAAAEAGRPAPRPFAYATRSAGDPDEVTCPECVKVGATADQSFQIHHDPDLLALAGPEADTRRTGPYGYGRYGSPPAPRAEITR